MISSARLLALLAVALVHAVSARAQTPLASIRYAPDITVLLGGTLVTPRNIAEDDLSGGVTLVGAGSYPNGTQIEAYSPLPGGNQLFAFDVDVILPGGITARPGDIVRFNGATYQIEFDAAAAGIPTGVRTDALCWLGPDNFLVSFDVDVDFGGFTAGGEDVVRIQSGNATLFFDGSAQGVPPGLDLDALDCLDSNGHLLMSFDVGGTIAGITFDDDDVLEFAPGPDTWVLSYDGGIEHAAWPPADLASLSARTGSGGGAVPPSIQGSMPGPGGVGGNGGLPVGTTRVFGVGTPHAIPGDTCIEIYSVGSNGVPDDPPGSVDDELLGTGGTDADGNFVDGMDMPGIMIDPPLGPDTRIFAYDVCEDLVGPVTGAQFPAPVLSLAGYALAVVILFFVAALGLTRSGALVHW